MYTPYMAREMRDGRRMAQSRVREELHGMIAMPCTRLGGGGDSGGGGGGGVSGGQGQPETRLRHAIGRSPIATSQPSDAPTVLWLPAFSAGALPLCRSSFLLFRLQLPRVSSLSAHPPVGPGADICT